MIESLSISKVATYGDEPEVLNKLSKINFIFGSNGTGKTTVSRVIAEAKGHEHCEVNWVGDTKLQVLVYNRDFVDAEFNQSTEIKGVFTLGKNNIEIQNKISEAKSELESLGNKITNLKKALNGDDGISGKSGELEALEASLKNKCWEQKRKHDAKLKSAFEGYRNNADNFKDKVVLELENNMVTLMPLTNLEKRAETIFGEAPNREIEVPKINATSLMGYEVNPVLNKLVLGKEDVDIAGMIKKLGNSDWVRQGRKFYDVNEGVCPFCQQDMNDNFATSLLEYFDETFEKESQSIADLEVNYKSEAVCLQQKITEIISKPSRFLNIEKFKLEKQLLDSTIAGNLQKLESKKKEPSQLVELDSIANLIKAIETLIYEANANIIQHNTTVDNIAQERKTLTEQVWKFILEELKIDLSDYKNKKTNLDSAITSLNSQLSIKKMEDKQKVQEMKKLEKHTSSIQPTINGINTMLKSFGFHGFSLAAVDNQHYKLIRADGKDAKTTLSEGERTFVTFLYFYHLLKGSNSESGITTNRVVVFDDPVSSLDSDILFIVSSLIKGLFNDVRGGNCYIKQIFVLTHNVYFHKEVSFNNKRSSDQTLKDETFWIIRKDDLLSKIDKHNSNPIKTSYELLWMDVKERRNPNPTVQNTLRRILEHYFKILGGINFDKLCTEFEGKDRVICNSLFSWLHDGSHSVFDDLYVSNDDTAVETYLRIFKEIFEDSGHIAHYEMMMDKDSYVDKT